MARGGTTYRVSAGDVGKRLDRYLSEKIPKLSRSRIQRSIRERVSLSWTPRARPSSRLRAGGEIHVGFPAIEEKPVDFDLRVLARSRGWIAVDKPAGMPVHPVNRVRANSLIRVLRRQEGNDDLRLVHRLDAETSGVLLIATDATTARRLSTAFERREVRKEYLALVSGRVEEDEGVVDETIGSARGSRVFVRLEAGVGDKRAVTRWRVERRLEHRTLLRIFPETGRRHQIRVHLASIGHPLLGELLYGRPDSDYLDIVRGGRDPNGHHAAALDAGRAPR
ncbi:MAG: RluA family pseudouridine synthase, partial [Acidobacteriota bacterium]|nr:RluA family pseudouridine synthase [Acidobacteriota bacterium]